MDRRKRSDPKAPLKYWAVYIVQCSDGTLYTGVTNDVDARIAAHNSGKGAKYTRSRRPVHCIYAILFMGGTRSKAQKWEYQIKQMSRAEKLKLAEEGGGPSGRR